MEGQLSKEKMYIEKNCTENIGGMGLHVLGISSALNSKMFKAAKTPRVSKRPWATWTPGGSTGLRPCSRLVLRFSYDLLRQAYQQMDLFRT